EPFARNIPLEFKKQKISITICEDILQGGPFPRKQNYKNNPVSNLTKTRPDIIINISASSYSCGKTIERIKLLTKLAKKTGSYIVHCNSVGENDELIFDGNSLIISPKGNIISKAAAFKEDLITLDMKNHEETAPLKQLPQEEETVQALTLGIKDYFHKQGFKKAVFGMSGGIDSAVIGCLAVNALGKENVCAVMMPSKYTSKQSTSDAKALCENLGINFLTIPINAIHKAYSENIFNEKKEDSVDTTQQNIQARIRGNILMALANKNGWLVLATGNKSESAVGYCTLYGDSAGALAPIGDILKTDVYKIAAHLNKNNILIPQSIIKKAPSAELKPNQTDQDDLPPYEVLDKIITAYIEDENTPQNIVNSGIGDKKTVFSIIKRIEDNEFKRKQFPLSFKMSKKSLGSCRKMPIVKDISFAFKTK
ncbi:MAG: NAD(+) synthase, partial [Elusimicrobiales bacterium]|nr:NAD(+) synthase [Elusimicrobiales bacterium]